jgi:DGQHR domain-containing protein
MADPMLSAIANLTDENRLRYSVSLVTQGKNQFYTLTIPSDVLAETCVVTTRKENAKDGFQRELDETRALEIAHYIDQGGTIPSSIILSAQPDAQLAIVGKGKTLEFTKTQGAFLILDGQHRVYGFSKATTALRVPVVIYNGLTRKDESRLFIDINTKQRPVSSQLLLDIKQLAEIETEAEVILRDIFDMFKDQIGSALSGLMSPAESARGKISRVTFNAGVKPLLSYFTGRDPTQIYSILNAYFSAITSELGNKTDVSVITKATTFKAFCGLFPAVVQRVSDRFNSTYDADNFQKILAPIFQNLQIKKLTNPGTSWINLASFLEEKLRSRLVI